MKWTDLPAASPVRDLASWFVEERRRGRVSPEVLDDVAARARDARPTPLVLVGTRVLEEVLRYLRESPLERGGLLAGVPLSLQAPDGAIALVHVTAAVPGVDDDATALSLRLAGSVWSRANAQLTAGEVVVGWFHSHPGIGAFFSDTDRRTQAAFFRQRYALGWVVDPLRDEHAWFVGAGAATVAPGAVTIG